MTLSGKRTHYSFNDIFSFEVNWMISLIAALSITTGLLRDSVISLRSEQAATTRLINNFSGKIFLFFCSEQKHLKVLNFAREKYIGHLNQTGPLFSPIFHSCTKSRGSHFWLIPTSLTVALRQPRSHTEISRTNPASDLNVCPFSCAVF
jgi:hypothetical protein